MSAQHHLTRRHGVFYYRRRVPILSRHDGAVVGLVARRDLLRVRLQGRRQETEREVLIPLRGGRTSAAAE